MNEFTYRFKTLCSYLKALGLGRQEDLAEALGVSRVHLSSVINCKYPLSDAMAEKLKKIAPNLNLDWLRTGEGEMLIGATEGSAPKIPIVQVAEHVRGNVGQSVSVGRRQPDVTSEISRLRSVIESQQDTIRKQQDMIAQLQAQQQEMMRQQLEIISKLASGK
jgi:transcriptional regulator with XRE-family HTH domain